MVLSQVTGNHLENAQRRATRLIPSLASLPYEQRLMKLDLPTLGVYAFDLIAWVLWI